MAVGGEKNLMPKLRDCVAFHREYTVCYFFNNIHVGPGENLCRIFVNLQRILQDLQRYYKDPQRQGSSKDPQGFLEDLLSILWRSSQRSLQKSFQESLGINKEKVIPNKGDIYYLQIDERVIAEKDN